VQDRFEARPFDNRLLAALPRADWELLGPLLDTVRFEQGAVLGEPGLEVADIYFPLSGLVSLIMPMPDGTEAETASVGRAGVIGAMAGLNLYRSNVQAVVQLPTVACRVSSIAMRKAAASSKAIATLCVQSNEALLFQTRVNAACNALHKVEARLCRKLLWAQDNVHDETFQLTQESIAKMLGVRRSSVTDIASNIQKQGILTYSRGNIRILDGDALERLSCDCYRIIRDR
jgi:CRP-like cAMP-binding protein